MNFSIAYVIANSEAASPGSAQKRGWGVGWPFHVIPVTQNWPGLPLSRTSIEDADTNFSHRKSSVPRYLHRWLAWLPAPYTSTLPSAVLEIPPISNCL